MSFKMLNSVDELMEYTGCNSIFIPRSVSVHYLIYTSEEPYRVDIYCSIIGDKPLSRASEYFESCDGNYLAIPNPNYINMEEYIREYKHLLGCEFVGSPKGNYVNNIVTNTWAISKNEPSLRCNFGYLTTLSHTKFFTEDAELVTYKEYMELYYPEYRDVWEKQL